MNNRQIVNNLINTAEKFIDLPRGKSINNPKDCIKLNNLKVSFRQILGTKTAKVMISRRAIKHIVEQRPKDAIYLLGSIPTILSSPTKITSNKSKRPNSFLFAKMNGKAKAIILEIQKNEKSNQVVSAFFMDKKTYKKLIDMSGRSDVPSSD